MAYPPQLFSNHDLDDALAVARAVKFAAIHLHDGAACPVIFAPLIQDGDEPVLIGHLVRVNPLNPLLERGAIGARLVFQAADGYVSPSVYREKAISGKAVPTWNYVAVQFDGTLERTPDAALMDILERQVAVFEASAGSDWQLSDAPADFVEKLAASVFGIRYRAESWTVHKKLSQNRADERPAVTDWLSSTAPAHRLISHWMKAP